MSTKESNTMQDAGREGAEDSLLPYSSKIVADGTIRACKSTTSCGGGAEDCFSRPVVTGNTTRKLVALRIGWHKFGSDDHTNSEGGVR